MTGRGMRAFLSEWRRLFWAPFAGLALGASVFELAADEAGAAQDGEFVGLSDVLRSVASQYPPMLSALIERDLAGGRLRQALGALDLQT